MEAEKSRTKDENIIQKCANNLLNLLNSFPYIQKNFDTFIKIMEFERVQEEKHQGDSLDTSSISLKEVFNLTREFLSKIDDSNVLINEFNNLEKQNKIVIRPSEKKSLYNNGVLKYSFDETMKTSYVLVHEFMHHIICQNEGHNLNKDEVSLLNEFISIYYEKAFISFLNQKGMLEDGCDSLASKRLKSEFEQDPHNCLLTLFKICKYKTDFGEISREEILKILKSDISKDTQNVDAVLEEKFSNLQEFCEEHCSAMDSIQNFIMYRFASGLAMKTNSEIGMASKIYTLAPFIKDRMHDEIFMQKYMMLINGNKTKLNQTSQNKKNNNDEIIV